ncbi:uncharacterized protein LOC117811839 [Notolabrus celidotus]|uniref:uncharacterized protein LOC117811839 n=1 Tax=Notolabrus celidotus TaxID=1203425 RepID=UPI00148F464F|nr:uncharacterized protein LOC117811839 [Notolabrus celidotus]
MACYYIVISSTHLRDGQLRSIKGVFRGPIGTTGQRSTEEGDSSLYCELCDKQYLRHQQYDNHINSYDHHHKQRLKELKQREFYRALACRRQRRRREEKREERALRRLHKDEDRRSGECAPGSGPMFRSTTVAVEPGNQSRPDSAQSLANMHTSNSSLGTNPRATLIQSFLPLDPALETRLLSSSQWGYGQMDANNTATTADHSSIFKKQQTDYTDLTAAAIAPNITSDNIMNTDKPTNFYTSNKRRHFNKIPWAHNYLSQPITPSDIPTTATKATINGSIYSTTNFSKKVQTTPAAITATTDISSNSNRAVCGLNGGIKSVPSRVRPVSFSLPKRTCVLLHQSAAVFIQAGQGSGLSGKQELVAAQERAKDLGEKIAHQRLKSPLSADVDNVGVDQWDTGNQCSVDSKVAIQHSETGANMSTERGTEEVSRTGAQVSLCNRSVIRVEDSVMNGNEAQISLCNDNGTQVQVSFESRTEAHLYLNSGIPGQVSDTVSTAVTKNSESKTEKHDNVDRETELNDSQELRDVLCSATNQPQKPTSILNEAKKSSIQTQPKEPNTSPSHRAKESTSLTPSRPKEPFCPVLSRDGTRVLLWPSEMVSYTKTSPSVSYSVNPLLYDFRAHSRTKEGGEAKKQGLEEARERIKPPVIKQVNCQQRQEVMEEEREGKIDEREDVDKGGQAGNPVKLVAGCSSAPTASDPNDCRDESALSLAPVSTVCQLAPTVGLQNTVRKRRRGRRGGSRRGMRKRGGKKRGEATDRNDSERVRRAISSLSENQMFEGREEKLKGEGAEKDERREKGLLSNLAAHRLVGGREKKMRADERRKRGDQTARERAGRNDEKSGELLSNLPVNRCNRCNQLCVQVKREASQHQSQQSTSGWGQGLRKLLSRGAACNSVISPVPGSVIEMPRCPAITPDPAQNDREMGEMHKNTQPGKGKGWRDEQQRNPRETEIRAVQDAKEDVCNLVISRVSFPCREVVREPEICLVHTPQRDSARDPAISPVPAPFRETACSQRQILPAGHSNLVLGPAPSCSTQQTEIQLRIRSACSDMTRPGDANSKEVVLRSSVTAGKRRMEALEAGEAPKKKRKRGRRQTRRLCPTLRTCAQRQEKACDVLNSDPCRDEASCMQWETLSDNCISCNTTECGQEGGRTEKNTDCHFLYRTKHFERQKTNIREGTLSGDPTDTPNTYCRCDDRHDCNCSANDPSHFSSESSGAVNLFSDCHTCNTPNDCRQDDEKEDGGKQHNDSGICSTTYDTPHNKNDKHDASEMNFKDHLSCVVEELNSQNERDAPSCDITDTPVDLLPKDFFTCSTNDTHTDHCQYKSTSVDSNPINHCDKTNSTSGSSEEDQTNQQGHNLSDSATDNRKSFGERNGNHCDNMDSSQCDHLNSKHVTDCHLCGFNGLSVSTARNASNAPALMSTLQEQREDEKDLERVRKEEEIKQMERRKVKERQEEWEKEWVRRKEKEKEDRERRKELDFGHFFPEKRPCFPHPLPSHCVPFHGPLLLPPSLSSSSSFSLHHTIIQHHLSLLPPPSHLPVPPYPHLLPSFSPHLSPLALNPTPAPPPPPPPPPPSFYTSTPIPLLDAPGPYPLATAFHPLQSHHPSLYAPPHPAVMPLQMLF